MLQNILIRAKFRDNYVNILNTSNDVANVNILSELLDTGINTNNLFFSSPCQHSLCLCCKNIANNNYIYNHYTKTNINLTEPLNCKSKNVLYIISCRICNMQYIGITDRQLNERFTNHRSTIKNKKSTAIAIHFNLPKHNLKSLIITPITKTNHLSNSDKLLLEKDYIKIFNTKYPNGLNNFPIIS